jgi:hypothetical protein
MKKILRNSIILSAFLLMALMVEATVIGGSSNSSTANYGNSSVAGCEDESQALKKLNCIGKDGGPAYGCSTSGTLEACTVAQACP